MARDTLTINSLSRNGSVDLGTTGAPTNGAAFTQANGQVATPKRASKFLLLVFNSKAGAIVVTIKKGVYPPAEDSGRGDLTVNISAQNKLALIGPYDGSRFLQANGSIQIDTDAAATGAMWVFELPT